MQSKFQSLLEVISNVLIGMVVSYFLSTLIIPHFTGVKLKAHEYGLMTAFYTTASLIRGYLLRRFWNKVHSKKQRIDS